jgi:hypothetical protein
MITAKLIGGLGNTMFQYAIARIIADQKQCNLLVEGIDTLTKFFPNAVNITDRMNLYGNILEIGYKSKEKHLHNINMSEAFHHNGPINIEGFFQKYELYKNYKTVIKTWFSYDESHFKKPTKNDLVIHYRLTDYTSLNWHLPPEAFIETIQKENIQYDNCYITTDQPNHPFIQQLLKKNMVVVNQNELADFTLLKYAKQLIVSHSSFSWWASFLGEQDKVYIPMYKNSTSIWKTFPNEVDDVDLIPNNTKYIKQILE